MLEFNQSDGGFDSPGPSLVDFFIFIIIRVETVQVVIRSAKWNYNPENSQFQQGERRSPQYFITFNVTFLLPFE